MQIESKTTSSLGCFAEMQLILCKDTIFFLIHQIFTPLFLLFAEKKQRQDDSDLSTSRFLSFDKSICCYRQVDSKELQDASEVDLLSRCHVCHVFFKNINIIIIFIIILIHIF